MGPGPGARRDATEKRNPGQGETTLAAKQLVVSGAGRAAMELGPIAANLLPIINLDIFHIGFICVTGSICIFASFPVEHVGIRFISRGTLTIINLDILHIRLICVLFR